MSQAPALTAMASRSTSTESMGSPQSKTQEQLLGALVRRDLSTILGIKRTFQAQGTMIQVTRSGEPVNICLVTLRAMAQESICPILNTHQEAPLQPRVKPQAQALIKLQVTLATSNLTSQHHQDPQGEQLALRPSSPAGEVPAEILLCRTEIPRVQAQNSETGADAKQSNT